MKETLWKILKYSLSAMLAIGLLYLSFREVKWADFISVLKSCDWMLVFLSMVAGLLSCVVRALRWKLILKPVNSKSSWGACMNGVCLGRFTNLAVQHVGEFVRCGVVSRRGTPFDKVLGTVVVERAWDVLMLILMTIITTVTSHDRFGSFFNDKILGPVTNRLNLGLSAILAVLAALIIGTIWILWYFRSRSRICGKIWGFLRGIADGMKSVLTMKGKGWFVVLTILLWFCFLMTSWLIIKALPEDYGLGLNDALFLMLVGAVASLVPVPGGFGAFHYIIALAVSSLYAISWDMGIIFATLSHESQTLTIIIAGVVCLVSELMTKRGADKAQVHNQ